MTQSPERSEIRAATFLAFQARLDAPGRSRTGKTRRTPKCNPPNKLCGSRCMPPEWDCRLKGEGADNHLRAVTTDPVGGAASIERGVRRIIKGVKKGSVAEVDAGRRAIVRGVVKATPGNIQDKKDKQKDLLKRTGLIVGITAVVAGGIAAHRSLAKIPFYRDGVYNPVNRAAFNALSSALDVTESTVMRGVRRFNPNALGIRESTRLRGRQSAASIVNSLHFSASNGPQALNARVGIPGSSLPDINGLNDYSAAISNHLEYEIGYARRTPRVSYKEWLRPSASGLFAIKARNGHVVYSEAATHDFLAESFRIQHLVRSTSSAYQVQEAMVSRIQEQAISLRRLAAQRNVDLTDQRQRTVFARNVLRESGATLPRDLQATAESTFDDYLMARDRTGIRSKIVKPLYANTVTQFDDLFQSASGHVNPPLELRGVDRGRAQALLDAEVIHARHAAQKLNPTLVVHGPSTAAVVNKTFFNRKVRGVNTNAISDREAQAAASEWAGTNVTSLAEAFRIVQRQPGLEHVVPGVDSSLRTIQRRQTANPTSPSNTDLSGITFNTATRNQAIASMRRLNRPNGTLFYATRESAEHAYNRAHSRGDSLSPRVRSFLEAQRRLDLEGPVKGKRCGRGYIPKGRKCVKGESAISKAAKIALGAGVATAAIYGGVKATGVDKYHTGIVSPKTGGYRKPRQSYVKQVYKGTPSADFRSKVAGIAKHPGVVTENVVSLNNFIKKHNINIVADPTAGMRKKYTGLDTNFDQLDTAVNLGACDGFAGFGETDIYVRPTRKRMDTWADGSAGAVDAADSFLASRSGGTSTKREVYAMPYNTKDGDSSELIAAIHETAHVMHFKASRKTGPFDPAPLINPAVKVGDRIVDVNGPLRASSTTYGRSDLTGGKAETFAENYTLYVLAGERFKREHPISYAWVDAIVKEAMKA